MGRIGNDEKRDGWNGWKDYYSYWDAFVARWLKRVEGGCAGPFPDDELTPSIAHFFGVGVRNERKRLVYDELPEPYYGDPERAKCVIIQMNLGLSDDAQKVGRSVSNDGTKCFSNKDNPDAFLIRSLMGIDGRFTDCKRSYRKFAQTWSSLKSAYPNGVDPADVCGHEWWHTRNRMQWIKGFTGADIEDVFDIEFCPYHSKAWNPAINRAIDGDYVRRRVVLPAAKAAGEMGCVICFSSSVRDYLRDILKADPIATWCNGKFWEGAHGVDAVTIDAWPKQNGVVPSHVYQLYRYSPADESHLSVLFLYVQTNCMKLPTRMEKVEAQIKDYIHGI